MSTLDELMQRCAEAEVVARRRAEAEDEWAAALAELRAELAWSLTEFREQCAPVVGPEVTRRGVVVSRPRQVPVDPRGRQRYAARNMSAQWRRAAAAVGEAMGQIRASFAPVLDALARVPTRDDFALVDDTSWPGVRASFALVDDNPWPGAR